MRSLLIVAVALGIGTAAALSIREIEPDPMTVTRLQQRAEAYVTNYPQDPNGVMTLGDIHAFAFRYRAFYLNSLWSTQFRKDKPPYVNGKTPKYAGIQAEARIRALTKMKVKAMPEDKASFARALEEEVQGLKNSGWEVPAMTREQELAHFRTAVANYEKMIGMKPTGVPHHAGAGTLALARLWEEFSSKNRYLTYEGLKDVPARKSDEEVALIYQQAFELTKRDGLRHLYRPYREMHPQIPAHEAATCYLRLLPEGKRAEEMKEFLRDLESSVR